jgi:hypothetical protein
VQKAWFETYRAEYCGNGVNGIPKRMTEIILCMVGMFFVGMFFGFELGRIVK